MICWIWGIFEEDRKAIRMIDSIVKDGFISDVRI